MLAAPSTPDEAIKAVEKQIDAGERIGVAYVQRMISDAKRKARLQSLEPLTEEGKMTSAAGVDGADHAHKQATQRLEATFSTVIELLSGQSAADWEMLFHTDALRRICSELVRLRSVLPKP
jgi:hypothetical protein